jgi:hypothetical protein
MGWPEAGSRRPHGPQRLPFPMVINASSRSFLMAGTHRPHRARQVIEITGTAEAGANPLDGRCVMEVTDRSVPMT